jgi:hypothetical protein
MSKYFEIEGYWKDDKSEFCGVVKEFDDFNEEQDDNVFYYGMGEVDIQEAMKEGKDTMLDFVITSYRVLG